MTPDVGLSKDCLLISSDPLKIILKFMVAGLVWESQKQQWEEKLLRAWRHDNKKARNTKLFSKK